MKEVLSTTSGSPGLMVPVMQCAPRSHDRTNAARDVNLEEDIGYWRQRLAGLSRELSLPTDRRRFEPEEFRAGWETIVFSKTLSRSVRSLAEQEGTTPFAVLLVACNILL